MAMHLIFLGPPGAGKGTFAGMLTEAFGPVHVSTGDILRAEMKAGTDLGKLARDHVDSGGLVPDEVIADVVDNRLRQADVRQNGFILDGFPRTMRQAELLAEGMDEMGWELDAIVLFDTDRELLLRRLTARRLCRGCGQMFNLLFGPPKVTGLCDACGGELYQRSDDSPETALDRLALYDRQTTPLIEYYNRSGRLEKVDSGGTLYLVFAALRKALSI